MTSLSLPVIVTTPDTTPEANKTAIKVQSKVMKTPQKNKIKKRIKPDKPYKDFPLFAHNNGQWAKKIKGRIEYFGAWENHTAALDLYLKEKDFLHAGKTVPADTCKVSLDNLVNGFIYAKESRVEAGELALRTWRDYIKVGKIILDTLGRTRAAADLTPTDFMTLRKRLDAVSASPVIRKNIIIRCRSIFAWGCRNKIIPQPYYGDALDMPAARTIKKHMQANKKIFTVEELQKLLANAGPQLKAMILLGINTAMTNVDIAWLTEDSLDLRDGWFKMPRHKNANPRYAKLWPETVEALRWVLEHRPQCELSESGHVFVTHLKRLYVRSSDKSELNQVTSIFGKLLKKCEISRDGRGFATLRPTFRTVADELLDNAACDMVMGHTPQNVLGENSEMGDLYRRKIGDKRFEAIADHVHAWLFPPKKTRKKNQT